MPQLNGVDEEDIEFEISDARIVKKNAKHMVMTLADVYTELANHKANEPLSYAGFSPSTNIGFVENFGDREEQQDSIAFGIISDFAHLSEAERKAALIETVADLESMAEKMKMEYIGSTLCLAVVCDHVVYTTNVGDSTAYLGIFDEHGKTKIFKRLNEILHVPTEPSEESRLTKEDKDRFLSRLKPYKNRYGQTLHFNRLLGLAMSRAIGDTALEAAGVIHTPDIYVSAFQLKKNWHGYVVVACDGLTESNCIAEKIKQGEKYKSPSIESLLRDNLALNPKELAKLLAQTAYDCESADNISVLVHAIPPNASAPIYLGVFDAHGYKGEKCAELIRRNLHPLLLKNIIKKLA